MQQWQPAILKWFKKGGSLKAIKIIARVCSEKYAKQMGSGKHY